MQSTATADSLVNAATRALDLAARSGADQAEVGVTFDEGLSVTVRLGELESVERQKDRGLAITVYKDLHKGGASTSDFSPAGVDSVVRKALSIASFTTADQYAGLADRQLMAVDPPDLDLHHPWGLDVDMAAELALRAENAARSFDPRIENSEGAVVSTSDGIRVYANSHGFVGTYPTSSHSLSCSVVAKSDGTLERDYWYSAARVADALEPPEAIGQRAARRAIDRLGAKQIDTCVAPVIFAPELARGLFGHLVAAISGTSQYRKASFLLDAAGKQVFPSWLRIREEPLIPRALASAAFDGEGVATQARDLVAAGILQGYVLSSYSARRLGLVTTGNAGGVHNLVVAPNAGPLADIIASCDTALVVTELLGQGVNIVTGDYSRGVAGFWVEKGKIVCPVSEVTIAGNLREMFTRIEAVGSDVDLRGTVRCGSVLVAGLTIAGR
jgi:PmbA protein